MRAVVPSSPPSAWFQAPTCRALGLGLELRMRNTARRLGGGEIRGAADRLLVHLCAYRNGQLAYSDAALRSIEREGALVIRDSDIGLSQVGENSAEDEYVLVARVWKEGGEGGFFSQEHQLVYSHGASKSRAYLLYDQQPARRHNDRAAPIVFLMPKIWLGEEVKTFVVVSNTWDVEEPTRQVSPVEFALLDESGMEVAAWQHYFFYNEARIFDLSQLIGGHVPIGQARFFTLVGRGGAGSFALFTIVRNVKSDNFAIEHSLPPAYYVDGMISRVRVQGCDVRLFKRGHKR